MTTPRRGDRVLYQTSEPPALASTAVVTDVISDDVVSLFVMMPTRTLQLQNVQRADTPTRSTWMWAETPPNV